MNMFWKGKSLDLACYGYHFITKFLKQRIRWNVSWYYMVWESVLYTSSAELMGLLLDT